ncbi:ABC transporter permease [Streptosporangium sp. NPDC051022]|uniref:ABC transporter permease n=1 Tax=Streptosporangium sp. NPDC051022 TaxID=3155752 RepID=UPI003422D210
MLSLNMVRGGPGGFAGAFVALCLGVALTSMTSLVFVSAAPRVPARYEGTGVLVRSPTAVQADGSFLEDRPWSPETVRSLTGLLAAVPGVSAAVADRSFYAQAVLDGRPSPSLLWGHPWSSAALAPYRLVSGSPPVRDREVVVDRALGLSPGAPVTLLTAAGPVPYTVSGVLDGPGLHVNDTAAARLSGGVRVIGLVTGPGADIAAVEAAARAIVGTRGQVFSGDARSALEPKSDERIRWIGTQVLVGMTILSTFVSIFVVASTFSFGVMRRRREFGLMRAVGATPRQVRATVYGEALAIGAVAALAGALLGVVLAPSFGGLLVQAGFEPPGFSVRIEAWPPLVSIAAGIVVAMLGVWSASRGASRVTPLEALREAAVDPRPMTRARWICGAVSGVAGIGCAAAVAGAAPEEIMSWSLYAAMTLIVCLTLLAPAILPPLVRALLRPLSGSRGAVWMLVREGSLAAIRRTASTTAPVLVTVGFAVLVTGMVQTSAGAFATGRAFAVRAGGVVVPDGTPGLSDAVVAAAGGVSTLPTTVYGEGVPPMEAAGVTREVLARSADRLSPVEGSLDTPGGLIVARRVARERGWRVGDTVPLTFEDGRAATPRVTAVVADAPAPLLLPRDVVRAHDPSALTKEVLVGGTAGSPGGDDLPGGRRLDVAAYAANSDAEEDRLVWLFTLILVGMAVAYTGISIAGTLAMATSGRVPDFRVLRMSGATPRQVLAVVTVESVLVTVMGTVLGTAVALPALLGMRSGLSGQIGAPVGLIVPWPAVLGVIGACLVLAVAGGVVPAARAVRRTG